MIFRVIYRSTRARRASISAHADLPFNEQPHLHSNSHSNYSLPLPLLPPAGPQYLGFSAPSLLLSPLEQSSNFSWIGPFQALQQACSSEHFNHSYSCTPTYILRPHFGAILVCTRCVPKKDFKNRVFAKCGISVQHGPNREFDIVVSGLDFFTRATLHSFIHSHAQPCTHSFTCTTLHLCTFATLFSR